MLSILSFYASVTIKQNSKKVSCIDVLIKFWAYFGPFGPQKNPERNFFRNSSYHFLIRWRPYFMQKSENFYHQFQRRTPDKQPNWQTDGEYFIRPHFLSPKSWPWIIHVKCTQNFPKNYYFSSPDTDTYVGTHL